MSEIGHETFSQLVSVYDLAQPASCEVETVCSMPNILQVKIRGIPVTINESLLV